jgi:hypothetical protein
MQAYTDEEYCSLLLTHGYKQVELLPGLSGRDSDQDLMVVIARK